MPPFEPYLAFRDVRKNNLDLVPAVPWPEMVLTKGTSLVLLIHGFNNTVEAASRSYSGWRMLQQELGGLGSANVVGVFWPGSNWENFAVYMQAIAKARATAPRLAEQLRIAAAKLGILRVRIVTHSLGARLTIELVRALSANLDPRVQLERFVVMAAAVPTRRLRPGEPLRASLDQLRIPFRSLYSPNDAVLTYALPLGESLGGGGFFPTALGREQWRGSSAIGAPQLDQRQNVGAGHSDYWFGSDNAESRNRARFAARLTREFLALGLVARELPERGTPSR